MKNARRFSFALVMIASLVIGLARAAAEAADVAAPAAAGAMPEPVAAYKRLDTIRADLIARL